MSWTPQQRAHLEQLLKNRWTSPEEIFKVLPDPNPDELSTPDSDDWIEGPEGCWPSHRFEQQAAAPSCIKK